MKMNVPALRGMLLVPLLALASCSGGREPPAAATAAAPERGPSAEMAWARAALDRNPGLEVLATDDAAGVFTVRERASGLVRTVKLAELAMVPTDDLAAPEPAAAVDSAAPPEAPTAQTGAEPALDYTVERSGGQVRVSGPGVSIVSATAPAAKAAAAENTPRPVDPIICDGDRVMRINDRTIVVTGDAITARNGCQLYVTNSRITATGTAVVVRDGTAHITNSTIEGGVASFDAGAGAKVFLQGATMKGTIRRDDGAEVHEQGNNRWR